MVCKCVWNFKHTPGDTPPLTKTCLLSLPKQIHQLGISIQTYEPMSLWGFYHSSHYNWWSSLQCPNKLPGRHLISFSSVLDITFSADLWGHHTLPYFLVYGFFIYCQTNFSDLPVSSGNFLPPKFLINPISTPLFAILQQLYLCSYQQCYPSRCHAGFGRTIPLLRKWRQKKEEFKVILSHMVGSEANLGYIRLWD